jgi:hypothetical protein
MKNLMLALLVAAALVGATHADPPSLNTMQPTSPPFSVQPLPPMNPGAAFGRAPRAFNHNFGISNVEPQMDDFNLAVRQKRALLKPGQCKDFYPIVATDDPGTPGQFFALEEVGKPIWKPWSQSFGPLRICVPQALPVSPPTSALPSLLKQTPAGPLPSLGVLPSTKPPKHSLGVDTTLPGLPRLPPALKPTGTNPVGQAPPSLGVLARNDTAKYSLGVNQTLPGLPAPAPVNLTNAKGSTK